MNKYAVFSYVTDRVKDIAIPVGVVAWAPELGRYRARFVKRTEALARVTPEEYLPFVSLVQEKLKHWEEQGQLPYAQEVFRPFEEGWWLHVRKLLNHEIRLSEPKPLACQDPKAALEALYLSVTAAHRSIREQRKGLKQVVKKCLRDLYYRLQPVQCDGQEGFDVDFWRGCRMGDQLVAINYLNLATPRARSSWDALLGRFARLEVRGDQNICLLLCYLPPLEESPEVGAGLRLVRERSERFQVRTFDLLREQDEFRHAAEELVQARC